MSQCKIYATIGPSCSSARIMEELIQAGMTGVRINLSHGSLEQMKPQIQQFKEVWEEQQHSQPDILIDLVGPELRIGTIEEPINLVENNQVLFERSSISANGAIPVNSQIFEHLKTGVCVILDDGKIMIKILRFLNGKWVGEVLRGGILSGRKSILLEGIQINNPTLTEEDLLNLRLLDDCNITGIMLPFVRGRADVENLRQAIKQCTTRNIKIMAKIENMDGVNQLEEISKEADEIIIARGDLGNAVGLAKLPMVQDRIASLCKEYGKPFMVVTQMLASMEQNPIPTRAEVNDIFQSIVQGTSSVMLTGETASGRYPVEAMRMLCTTVEESLFYLKKR